ncbi:hypothetical protein [Streptomyces sp. SP18CS02]|uniref:hypothetical protein n=1 Tax=Streptomyces sp. SP18CS02 TaxID=3002531 RepID=UPI002E76E49D|nr:hypothetical protein [Streptomyces sp. SP18CS02]MEE1753177.1 hypothetical protein [Streptomyces sp. SP18CS02]
MRLAPSVGLTSAALLVALLPAAGAGPSPASTATPARHGTGAAGRPPLAPRADERCDTRTAPGGPCVRYGPAAPLGRGQVRVFTEYAGGRPRTLGVLLTGAALTGLPTAPTDGEHCFDADGDGSAHPSHECVGGHGSELALPATGPSEPRLPFRWALFNWNPEGHSPHGRYDVPHFDVHFYLVPPEARARIRLGACALLIDCGQLPTAAAPVPAPHLPRGYPASSPQTAEGAMGGHLDSRPPTSGALSTHTFIYGAYAGEIIFMEPMLTKTFLERQRTTPGHRTCAPVPQPQAWRTEGWYPTRYCTAYRPDRDDYTVTLTGFVHRPAGGPR